MHSYISFDIFYYLGHLFTICFWFFFILFVFFIILWLLCSDCSYSILLVWFTFQWMVRLEISTIQRLFLIFSSL